MNGINIEDLTIEQYLRLKQENQTLGMVKKVDDMTIAEYIEYEERIKGQYECRAVPKNKQIRVVEVDLKSSKAMEDTVNNDSFTNNLPSLKELTLGSFLLPFTINNYNSYVMANIDVSNNVMPRSIYENLKLDNLGEATTSVKMDDMTQQETLGTGKNVLLKVNKFEFPCDFVVTDMPKNLREMIILGRPFLKTIHAQIDVFQEEISLGIGKDRIKFDAKGNPCQSNI
ncbi:reverse transcriptase domain-containing protein [Tanacetum coccineum]